MGVRKLCWGHSKRELSYRTLLQLMRSAALAAAAGAVLCGSTLQFLQPPLLECMGSACDRRRSTAEGRVLYCLHCCCSKASCAANFTPACLPSSTFNRPSGENKSAAGQATTEQLCATVNGERPRLPAVLRICRPTYICPAVCGELLRLGSGVLVPVVRVTGVLPQLRTLKLEGALMSYHSFFRKGSSL